MQYVSAQLDNGTFWGTNSGAIKRFLGIPYAQPPIGNLRFRPPLPSDPYSGTYDSGFFSVSCPQQVPPLNIPIGFEALTQSFVASYASTQVGPWGEDCLTINIWTPANITAGMKLPVIAYIFGGGFEAGSTSAYDPTAIIERSVEIGDPVMFVSMNYRVSAFGFLSGKEVAEAGVGNIGLQDQRLALRWIQKYISAFNGDPSKVTLWGESSGAISIAQQMLTNGGNTEGLFHAAFMNSGSPIPVGDFTHGQKYYDELVQATGCANETDTLQCLREVPYLALKAAIDATPHILSYQSLNLAWLPRADGDFVTDDPQKSVLNGSVANIPFVTGDLDDEGTLFALYSLNLTADVEAQDYIHSNYLHNATAEQIEKLMELYPQDPVQGSPFDTGANNVLTPEYKRIAAVAGDLVFTGPRRFFLQQRADQQNAWSFCASESSSLTAPQYHGSDGPEFFAPGGQMIDYLVNFVNHFDPNGQNLTAWPKYTTATPTLLTLDDGPIPLTLTNDTFRQEAMAYLVELGLQHPL
ncbi:hypothetical protein PHLGIDRAFT_78736 [Phlebiopsis gigantea 11061_1 CR5-6]|uniref:Carboxylesterase type B domain-containing protein n=1 Tax=Phlebiopsis gigantea (strain 11061_1 CR5-6) TaxID=745531 RepID=A0A0C3PC91_PHLG1|nr:hypothetical protein PHLGIDRAFT_78736 [Phlebiopsis gigantea 11061_1 CR5-6]